MGFECFMTVTEGVVLKVLVRNRPLVIQVLEGI